MKSIFKSAILSLFLILLSISPSLAQKTFYDLFLETGNEPKLTQQEVEALKLVAHWQNSSTKTTPIVQLWLRKIFLSQNRIKILTIRKGFL